MTIRNNYLGYKDHHRPIVFNIFLWLISFFVLLLIFSKGKAPLKIDYIYTGSFLATLVLPILINLYVLIPFFLKREKYIQFIFLFLINLAVFTFLNATFFTSLLDRIFSDYYFISYHSNTKLITIFSVFLVGTALLKLSEDWFYFNRTENRRLKDENLLIQEQLASLRSQINPHFLFNSLNVVYALALDKKEETTNAIVQLSYILRYIIYDTSVGSITLKQELKLLKNYIEFQKFRVHGFDDTQLNVNIEDENYKLYPMLLLPLLENSYKHGIKGSLTDTYVHIDILQQGDYFSFKIENNKEDSETENEVHYSGVGIENIRHNLELVYPDTHHLNITNSTEKFIVQLELNPK